MSMRAGRACLGASLAAALTPTAIAVVTVAFDPVPFNLGLHVMLMLLSILYGFPIALIHALFLGLPAYLLFARGRRLHWLQGVIGGLLTGMIPVSSGIAWSIIVSGAQFGSVTDIIYLPIYCGLCGAVGGFFFWRKIRSEPHADGAFDP